MIFILREARLDFFRRGNPAPLKFFRYAGDRAVNVNADVGGSLALVNQGQRGTQQLERLRQLFIRSLLISQGPAPRGC